MDENNGLQVFAIREARPHPWVLSTTRHLSQGGVSLLDAEWDAEHLVLSGRSAVVVDDPYVLTVHVPEGFRVKSAVADGVPDSGFEARRKAGIICRVTYEQMPDQWQEWLDLTPLERFRQSEELFAQYLAMGGSLDPDPDPTSPFYDPQTSGAGPAYGRPGLRVLRRGTV